jgi:hypothetical protein
VQAEPLRHTNPQNSKTFWKRVSQIVSLDNRIVVCNTTPTVVVRIVLKSTVSHTHIITFSGGQPSNGVWL